MDPNSVWFFVYKRYKWTLLAKTFTVRSTHEGYLRNSMLIFGTCVEYGTSTFVDAIVIIPNVFEIPFEWFTTHIGIYHLRVTPYTFPFAFWLWDKSYFRHSVLVFGTRVKRHLTAYPNRLVIHPPLTWGPEPPLTTHVAKDILAFAFWRQGMTIRQKQRQQEKKISS